uniref:CCHC-type domain-containing protein n=1 Tax=Strongyloides papillosus TaxID=174720 RepID=A0A0N5C1Q5_STREA
PRKESFEKYLVLLEEAFLLDDLDNEGKRMAIVKLKSTEEVRAYIASLPKPITFKVLCERLTANFNSIANKTNVKVQMRHFKIDLEKLHSNILQFMDLVARSTTRVDNELFEYQVECLMDKLSFNRMLFQRMVDSTHRYENIYDIAADIENYHKNMSKMRISNASFSENPERKRSSVTCYRCKKISHIASQCKEENVVKLEDVKPTLNAQSKECKVQNVMHENRVVDSWEPIIYMKDEIREKAMHAAGLQHSEEKIRCGTTLFLPVFIENNERVCETVGFIDTGANASMVSRVVVDRLKVPVKKNQNILITLANGETRNLQETVKLTVRFKNKGKEKAMHAAGLQHSEEKIRCGTTLFLPVFIETNERVCETVGFIDTGANVSMVSRVVVDRLKVLVKNNQNILITSANGETRNLQETVKLTVRFKNKGNTDVCKDVVMLINDVEKKYHVTVGSDILKRVGALIDYQRGMMITTHHPEGIQFIMEKEHFNRLAFGLKNASAYAQCISEKIAEGTKARPYIDDFIIVSEKEYDEHVNDVILFCNRLKLFNVTANQNKSYFACKSIVALGAVSWFRDNIPGLAKATRPLCQVMNIKKEFTVTQEMIDAFEDTKRAVADACLNYHARDDREFTLVSDASNGALAAALLQESDVGGYHPVAFFSRSIPLRKKYEFDIKVDDVIHDDEIKDVDEKIERMCLSAFELEIKS